MRRSALPVLVFLAALTVAHAQTAEPPSPDWFWDKPIADITFEGLVSVSATELRPIVRPYVGQPLTLEVFQAIQDKLLGLNYFDRAEGEAVRGDDGWTSVIILFKVQERPTVAAIQIRGNLRVGNPAILEAILVKRGDMVTDTTVALDAESIRQLYLEKGYTKVEVTAKQEPNTEGNTVDVTFEIVEGPQTKIRDVTFSGNSFASESTLRRLMKTRKQSLLSSGDFQEAVFEEDKGAILDYYRQNGFIDALIEKAEQNLVPDLENNRTNLDITIYIVEGQQFTFGGLSFEGNELFSTEQLNAQVRMQVGKPANMQQLSSAVGRVQDLYYTDGYLDTRFQDEVTKDPATGVATWVIHIREGDRVHIENIVLSGNEKTKDYVILREIPLEEGDVYSTTKIRQAYYNLANLQYFSSVVPTYAEGSARGLADLVITVEEQSTAAFNFGVTFSGGDYPIAGKVGWSENNFLGMGLKLGVDGEISNVRQSLSLSFQEPYLFGKRWSGGANLSASHELVSGVPQDVLGPVFTDLDYDNGLAVPDPYDGHYVDATTGAAFDWTADGRVPADYDTLEEIQAIVDENDLVTDYEYAGSSVPSDYTMAYDKFAIAIGLRTGVRVPTVVGTFRVDPYISSSLDYKIYDSTIYRPYRKEDREGLDRWLVVNTLGLGLAWDKRDYALNPQQGFYVGESVASVGGLLFGWKHYIKTITTLEGYVTPISVPVSDTYSFKVVLAAHASLQFLLPQWHYDADSTSWLWSAVNETSDELYVDGMSTARGWRSVLPGKAMLESQLEVRIPISEQLLWWSFFFDAAGVWSEPAGMGALGIDDFYFSFGAGLRFTHPQFPIRMYLAKGFRINNGVQWKTGDLDLGAFSLDFVVSLGGLTF